ncbi:MAG: rod shape-determining protein RodA [Bacteroidales bacterium]|nr:rod shape-determining protein RodA [Bacteroidales bacterium]
MRNPEHLKIDWTAIGLWCAITLFGWINIYAACYDESQAAVFDFSTKHGKQIIWIGVAAIMALVIMFTTPRFFSNTAYVIYGIVMVLLVVTLFIATATKGGKSWIDFGPFKFQPSEFGKFATALALSKYMSDINRDIQQTSTKITAIVLVAVPMLLVFLQHDTGSALVFLGFILPLYREGLPAGVLIFGLLAIVLFVMALLINKYILIGIIVVVALSHLFIWLNKRTRRNYSRTLLVAVGCVLFVLSVDMVFNHVLESHQRERIEVLLGKSTDMRGSGYNQNQSKIAIGSGGIVGKGFLRGTLTKADFVPEQETDFIFCTVGEEWGFVGSVALCAAYIWLLVHLISMAERQRSRFARFYGYSVASILFVHYAINIGMVLGVVPVIGIPLPFFSYGGSSMLAFTILLFVFIRQDASKNQLL